MADYYPVLARSVARLPDNTAQARLRLYARARAVIAEQLRSGEKSALEIVREQTALEGAIRRVEAEAQPAKPPLSGSPPAPARAAPDNRAATHLARILAELQAAPGREAKPRAATPASGMAGGSRPRTADALGTMPRSLGAMLLMLAYMVTATAFTGVIYIRGLVWVAAGRLPYPLLLTASAIAVALFAMPLVAVLRQTWSPPPVGLVFRLIYAASRRVF